VTSERKYKTITFAAKKQTHSRPRARFCNRAEADGGAEGLSACFCGAIKSTAMDRRVKWTAHKVSGQVRETAVDSDYSLMSQRLPWSCYSKNIAN
jgi:hypothetical protein